MSVWQDSRRLNEEERHRESVAAMRRHPLAMDPAAVHRACTASLQRSRPALATIHAFVVPAAAPRCSGPALTLEQAATRYLATENPPSGLVKALDAEHGLNYASLHTKIGKLRDRARTA